MNNELKLTQEWDKAFPKNDAVNHRKVTFTNHFGIKLAADLYEPKHYEGKLMAVAVWGTLWSGQGTGQRTVCSGNGRKRDPCDRL